MSKRKIFRTVATMFFVVAVIVAVLFFCHAIDRLWPSMPDEFLAASVHVTFSVIAAFLWGCIGSVAPVIAGIAFWSSQD